MLRLRVGFFAHFLGVFLWKKSVPPVDMSILRKAMCELVHAEPLLLGWWWRLTASGTPAAPCKTTYCCLVEGQVHARVNGSGHKTCPTNQAQEAAQEGNPAWADCRVKLLLLLDLDGQTHLANCP